MAQRPWTRGNFVDMARRLANLAERPSERPRGEQDLQLLVHIPTLARTAVSAPAAAPCVSVPQLSCG